MEQQKTQNVLMELVKKAKLQSITVVLFIVSLVAMMLSWFSIDTMGLDSYFKGIDTSISFFEASGFLDLVVFVVTVVAIGATVYGMYAVYKNKPNAKLTLGAIVLSALGGAVNLVLGALYFMDKKEDGLDAGLGFYLFLAVNAAAAVINGLKAYQNKAAVQKLAGEVKTMAESKMDKGPETPVAPAK